MKMAESDDVRVPRKVWNSVVAALVGMAYWLMMQGYQWMIRMDKHLESTDRTAWELQKDIQRLREENKK